MLLRCDARRAHLIALRQRRVGVPGSLLAACHRESADDQRLLVEVRGHVPDALEGDEEDGAERGRKRTDATTQVVPRGRQEDLRHAMIAGQGPRRHAFKRGLAYHVEHPEPATFRDLHIAEGVLLVERHAQLLAQAVVNEQPGPFVPKRAAAHSARRPAGPALRPKLQPAIQSRRGVAPPFFEVLAWVQRVRALGCHAVTHVGNTLPLVHVRTWWRPLCSQHVQGEDALRGRVL
mmetsp:Transcript_20120/g.55673  ORF Transcript_20120/g.55673 Transcript_20120/m.55673 type:complete len:234 (-) Transcript_20120:1201-1902(-)